MSSKLPGVLALGYISAFDGSIASQVLAAKAVEPLKQAVIKVPDDLVKAAVCWTLGMIGGHTPGHAKALAEHDVLTHLLAVYVFKESTQELKSQAKKALKSIIRMSSETHPLQRLLSDAPTEIQKHLVRQLAKNLARSKDAQKAFVMDEGLRKIQGIQVEPGSKLR